MNVYIVTTACGEWEDYMESREGVFSTLEKAQKWFADNGYTPDKEDKPFQDIVYSLEAKDFGQEPKIEEFDNFQEWKEEWDYWKEAVDSDIPFWSEIYTGWISEEEVL